MLIALALASVLAPSVAERDVGVQYVNWDGIKKCNPLAYTTPRNEQEVINAILDSKNNNEQLKVVGGGLSFSGIQMSSPMIGNLMSLDKLNVIISVQPLADGGALVEVGAGIRLRVLCRELELRGLALVNMGATATQSFIGAATTGTHGTGVNLGGLASQIEGFRIIDGNGIPHVASATENKDLFDAGRVGIGALGVITSVTIRAVPLFKLKKTTISYSLSQLLLDLPSLMDKYERLQWSWIPYTDSATVIIREEAPMTTPNYPEGGCWSTTQSTKNCTDLSYKALTDSLHGYINRDLYTEMEMFIPFEDTMNAVNDFISFMDSVKEKHDPSVYISGMVRYVQGDDITLSPMNGRNTSVMSFIVAGDHEVTGDQDEFEMYARGLEDLTEQYYEGRPHWGKVNYANTQSIKKSYGDKNFNDFMSVRETMDPMDVFMNEYLVDRLI